MTVDFQSSDLRFPVPYVMFHGRPDALVLGDAQLDRFGFRNPFDPTAPRREGEARVFVLGGSAVVLGSPWEATVPGFLMGKLRKAGASHVTVYNFGMVSAMSGQELALLTHQLVALRPDHVIVYDGANDLFQPFFHDPRPGFPFNYHIVEAVLHAVRVNSAGGGMTVGFEGFNLDFKALRASVGYGTPAWEAAIREAYIANLTRIAEVAIGAGFGLSLFLQPTVFTKTPKVGPEPGHCQPPAFAAYMERQIPATRALFAGLRQRFATHDRIQVEDLSDVFTGVEHAVYTDLVHIGYLSNATIADAMLERLRPRFPAVAG